jgi:hypothetical protein
MKKLVNFEGVTVALETNSTAVADRFAASLATPPSNSSQGIVSWRIVAEADTSANEFASPFTHLQADGMAFISLGLQGFLAYDRQARIGIAFIPEDVANDETLFRTVFLPCLASIMQH